MVNFRKSFITKCLPTDGTAEDKDSLAEVLRNSAEADNSKLVAYAWQHVIPAAERLTVYKQLLGIAGAYPETKEIIAKHREDEARVLLDGLRGLRRFEGTVSEDGVANPTPGDIVKMVLISLDLFSKNVIDQPPYLRKLKETATYNDVVERQKVLAIIAIVNQVKHLSSATYIDIFHISQRIFKVIDEAFSREGIVEQYVNEIRFTVINNHNLTNTRAHSSEMAISLRCCLADIVTSPRTMFLIFDKIVTGQSVTTLIRSFAIAFIVTLAQGEMEEAVQHKCATQAIDDTWKAMRTNRLSLPRDLPRPVLGRHSYSIGENR